MAANTKIEQNALTSDAWSLFCGSLKSIGSLALGNPADFKARAARLMRLDVLYSLKKLVLVTVRYDNKNADSTSRHCVGFSTIHSANRTNMVFQECRSCFRADDAKCW